MELPSHAWHPAFFGVKQEAIMKSGIVVTSLMGDANVAIERIYIPINDFVALFLSHFICSSVISP
ncbi:hypothetical protein [Paenibacillus macquariensis]|nr:hypothetical protein [Paenibacillus macquariensis]MEC0091163.1 hypothetical protein [Paenibacillus macquariensis]OAB33653.1 hypothetical protein PMSM_13585 [Paenibacillus macquariensis subsp. macquariensis]